jgi:hypothetical protein
MNSVVAAPVVRKLEEIDAGLDIEFVANRLRDPPVAVNLPQPGNEVGGGDDPGSDNAVAKIIGCGIVVIQLEAHDARAEARERPAGCPARKSPDVPSVFCSTLPVIPGSITITSLTGVLDIAAPVESISGTQQNPY